MLFKFLAFFLALTGVFFLQQYRLFVVGGVNPNLILVILAFLIFKTRNFWFFFGVGFGFLVFVFLTAPYWLLPVTVILLLTITFYFLRKMLTGNEFFDFPIVVFLNTIIFYLIFNFQALPLLPIRLIAAEILYNLILTAVFVFFSRSKIRYDQ